MTMEAIKGAGMTYQGSVSSAESQPKTDSAVKAAETDAPEKGIVSENIKQAGEGERKHFPGSRSTEYKCADQKSRG